MTRGTLMAGLAALLAAGAIATVVYTRLSPPAPSPLPTAELPYDCTTCDARQAGKKRLREHLQAQENQP